MFPESNVTYLFVLFAKANGVFRLAQASKNSQVSLILEILNYLLVCVADKVPNLL